MYNFKTISIKELEHLEYKANFPSNRFEWIYSWYEVFEKVENNIVGFQKQAYIVTAYENNQLVAIVPLVKLIRKFCKCIKLEFVEFLGQQWSCIGHDLIILKELDSSFIRQLLSWIKKNIRYHFIFFKYVPKKSILTKEFKMYRYSGAPMICISDYKDYNEFAQKVYAKKFRKKLDRTLRKIEKDGFRLSLSYEEINSSNFETIKRISKSKMLDGKSFVYDDVNKEKFHKSLYSKFPSHVMFANFNNYPVAYVANIDCDDARIAIDCAFDRDYRIYGVGVQCMDCNIRKTFSLSKEKYSFGVGMDAYKFQFTKTALPFYICFGLQNRLKSFLAKPFVLYRAKKSDQKVKQEFEGVEEYV